MYKVTLVSAGEPAEFICEEKASVLKSAYAAGYQLTCGCLQGRCMTCRARLLKGSVKSLRPLSRYATIDPANLEDGNVLLCSITPLEDIHIEPRSRVTTI